MYQTTYEYQQLANADSRRIQAKIEITAQSDLTENEIIDFELKESVCDNTIAIGTTNAQVFELTCRSTSHTFQSAYLRPYIGLNDEWCPLGVFIVADVELTDGEYKITAYDRMAYLDEPYAPSVSLPNTCRAVINDIAHKVGFTVDSSIVFPPGDLITGIEEDGCTYRQMIGYVAGLMGKNARFDRDGELTFSWFTQIMDVYGDVNEDNRVTSADIEIIESDLYGSTTVPEYEAILGRLIVGSARLGAEIKEKSFVADVNEDGVVDGDDIDEIQAYIDGVPYPDTKVGTIAAYRQEIPPTRYYLNELTDTGTFTFTSLVSGTKEEEIISGSGRAITFGNPYMTQAILNSIRAEILPFTYDAGTVTFIGNPAYEIGDILRVNGRDFPLMNQSLVYDGGLKSTVQSFGVTEEKQTITTSVPTLIESIRQVSSIDQKVAEINEELNNAQGLFGGTYKQLYGTDIDPSALSGLPIGWRVISNSNPNHWWQMTYAGLAYTNNGGASYKVGITNSGQILADTLVANAVLSNKVTAENLEITGGSINISTTNKGTNIIALNATNSYANLSPGAIGTYTSLNEYSTIQSNGVAIFRSATSETLISGGDIYASQIQASSAVFSGEVRATRTLATVGQSGYPQTVYLNPVSASVDPVYRATITGALGTSSSLREYKCDIMDVEAEEINPHRLYDLPVRQFHWRRDKNILNAEYEFDKWSIGFIAEEMDEFYPRATIYRDGKLASWSERNLVPAMLKLIQEQHAEIESLKEEIDGLKKQN